MEEKARTEVANYKLLFTKKMQIEDFADFPMCAPLRKTMNRGMQVTTGKYLEKLTVGDLMRLTPHFISHARGIGPVTMEQLSYWMEFHEVSFIDEKRLTYITPESEDFMSEYDSLWSTCIDSVTRKQLDSAVSELAEMRGKCYNPNAYEWKWMTSKCTRKQELTRVHTDARDNFLIADLLSIRESELQKMTGFSKHTMSAIGERMESLGLHFAK